MLYAMRNFHARCVKFGFTKSLETLKKRRSSIQTGSGAEIDIVWCIEGDRGQEKDVHGVLRPARLRGEWFAITPRVRHFMLHAPKAGATRALSLWDKHTQPEFIERITPNEWNRYFGGVCPNWRAMSDDGAQVSKAILDTAW